MKTYNIKLLTPAGIVAVTYTDNQDLTKFEEDLTAKYGTFITYSSEEIVPAAK